MRVVGERIMDDQFIDEAVDLVVDGAESFLQQIRDEERASSDSISLAYVLVDYIDSYGDEIIRSVLRKGENE